VKSLRRNIIVGALLWTAGLMSAWSVAITLNPAMFVSLRLVHSHAHFMGFLALVALAAGFAVVRSGFSPFAELRRRLADVQRGTERQLVGNYPAEVQPLVNDLNALLAHRDDAVRRAVAKAGDLAHGLKTPLAVLSQEAERAAAAGHAELAGVLAEQVERMRRQIEYHLAHARAAAAGAASGARCAVAGSAAPLARTLLRLHAGRGLTIDVLVAEDHVVRCQREDLDEMLGSLLDNACKWARSRVVVTSRTVPPEGGSHQVGAAGGSHAVEITVDDDGPGIAPALRDAVLQRGVRADEAAPGSGFGLAIVRELAELYGGSIALDASPAGGLRARLRLPSAPA
jgi:signal transduction histidine kinase